MALLPRLVSGQLAADRVATRAWALQLKRDLLRGLAPGWRGGAICAPVKEWW